MIALAAEPRRGDPRRRRDPQPRLARSRRHFKTAGAVGAKVIQVSVDHHLHNGWSMDYQGLPPVDVFIACEPEAAVTALLAALGDGKRPAAANKHDLPAPAGDDEGQRAQEHDHADALPFRISAADQRRQEEAARHPGGGDPEDG